MLLYAKITSMKKKFERITDISVRQITSEDWEAYRDYWKGLSDPAHFSGIMTERDLDDPQTYSDLFEAIGTSNVMFGLFDKDRMIGQAGVFFDDLNGETTAMFQGAEIADEYRGFGLSKELYDARMRKLYDRDYDGKIVTSIRPDNEPSLRAAEKSGFRRTNETVYDKVVMERDGVDLEVV